MISRQMGRGGIQSSPEKIAAAPRFVPTQAPPTYIIRPPQLQIWGNDNHGDCVTAEEAFAKACHAPEIDIGVLEVLAWATAHGVLEGASYVGVLELMQTQGFVMNGNEYLDGPYSWVDFTNRAHLESAITKGPIKLAVASSQLHDAYWKPGGEFMPPGVTWFGIGFRPEADIDHCISLCGYGTVAWLAGELDVPVPKGIDVQLPAYAAFTWGWIGIIDNISMLNITREAWLRQPTTIIRPIEIGVGPVFHGPKPPP